MSILDANLRDFDTAYPLLLDPHGFIEAIKQGIRELRGGNPSDGDAGHVFARVTFEKQRFGTLRDAILDRATPGGSTGSGPVVQPGPGNETPLSLGYVAWHENEITIAATNNDAAGLRLARPANGDSACGKVSFNTERIDSRTGERKYIEQSLIIGSVGEMKFCLNDGRGGDDRNMPTVLTLRPHSAEFHVPVNIPGSGGGGGPILAEDGELYRFDKQFAESGAVSRMTQLHFIPKGSALAIEGAIGVGPGNSDMVDFANGNKTWRQIIVGCARRALPMGIEPPR